MRKKYRYILCGIVNPTDKIKIFRLIAANCLGNRTSAIRIPIPKDMILEKWSCDNYSTTFDERTLNMFEGRYSSGLQEINKELKEIIDNN